MKEIALYTLDIAQNSITAQARRLDITLTEEGKTITLSIRDDGTGMAPELLARVKANIRRTAMLQAGAEEPAAVITAGGLSINPENYQVTKHGAPVDLTQREYELLFFLAGHPGKVYSRTDLMEQVWNYDYVGDDVRTVDVHVRRLREKVETNPSDPRYVYTKWGVGYYYKG